MAETNRKGKKKKCCESVSTKRRAAAISPREVSGLFSFLCGAKSIKTNVKFSWDGAHVCGARYANAAIHGIIQLFVGPYAVIPTVKPMVTATVNNHDYETSHGCHTLLWQPHCCQPVKALQIFLRTDYRLHTYSSVSPYIPVFVLTIHFYYHIFFPSFFLSLL